MKLFNIFKAFRQSSTSDKIIKSEDYLPRFWEDDYCQIEIVPIANKDYVFKTIEQINDLANKSRTDFGFTETYARRQMPVPTFSEEIRIDYLEQLLGSFNFEKAKNIYYDGYKTLDCNKSKTKAHGFADFTLFFDTEDEFVKNIWLSIGIGKDFKQYDSIKSALYSIGEECEMFLVDWNSLELIDLRNLRQIENYLNEYLKQGSS